MWSVVFHSLMVVALPRPYDEQQEAPVACPCSESSIIVETIESIMHGPIIEGVDVDNAKLESIRRIG